MVTKRPIQEPSELAGTIPSGSQPEAACTSKEGLRLVAGRLARRAEGRLKGAAQGAATDAAPQPPAPNAVLDQASLNQLAGQVRDLAPDTHASLLGIAGRMGNPRQTTSSAINGMASRLGALRAGRFGAVLNGDGPALELEKAAAEPGVTYISLPALASSADLRMMGRVLLHDLKLLAHLRLDPARRPRPCLVVLDEFSALDDPDNVRDFLRQAREPEMPCVTASQSLPEPGGCRNELLQAGVVLSSSAWLPTPRSLPSWRVRWSARRWTARSSSSLAQQPGRSE